MEQYKVKIYPSAQQDMRDIISYLNTLSPDTALRYYDKLTEELPACPPCRSDALNRGIWLWQQRVTAI